jgi:hypothetical protein
MLYKSNWYNPSEKAEALARQRNAIRYAIREKELAKPQRSSNFDGEISKRRDKS